MIFFVSIFYRKSGCMTLDKYGQVIQSRFVYLIIFFFTDNNQNFDIYITIYNNLIKQIWNPDWCYNVSTCNSFIYGDQFIKSW